MKKKITENTSSENKETSKLIKSLGGAKVIHSHLLSKNKNINIDSIYKWKTNGIPYRYRLYIKELIESKGLSISENSFADRKKIAQAEKEIISNFNNTKFSINNNASLYLTVLFFIIFLLYVLYSHHNNEVVNDKILELEKFTSTVPTTMYDKEIVSILKNQKEQDVLINNNSANIDKISNFNNEYKEIINKIKKDLVDISLINKVKIDSDYVNTNYILLYLIDMKNDITYSVPNLSKIDIINSYLNNNILPEDVKVALKNLNEIKDIKFKGHKEILLQISLVSNNINKPTNNNINQEVSLFNKIKKLVKISKVNNKIHKNIDDSYSILAQTLLSNNYKQTLNELNLINKFNVLDKQIEDVKNLKILYESVDIIIKWLIFKE
jgi:hypothetical protein